MNSITHKRRTDNATHDKSQHKWWWIRIYVLTGTEGNRTNGKTCTTLLSLRIPIGNSVTPLCLTAEYILICTLNPSRLPYLLASAPIQSPAVLAPELPESHARRCILLSPRRMKALVAVCLPFLHWHRYIPAGNWRRHTVDIYLLQREFTRRTTKLPCDTGHR